ncbi:hypothetical protein JS84_21555 [Vibrio vulnificus]|uniref:lysozyme inhibitor LprI family protein n=1 Tax=Vibrio vulnificus TaxID=672 RepID=UPI0003642E8E|nr:lysozyme inhibitor LprI family protein [Vibrio vulnificus]KFK58672.1 hypothetical protein JS83_17375 [Vibrio vulnificus]KFK62498.1 hypothetical protein JS84_21555 [Vibrio vulnificus]KFK68357.1 hypothetical protein JS85_14835 [Vibrio vulnificus]KOR96211.1 hypothetical protein LO82_19275 [Vibrio vulnificus]NHE85924.1 DUF1311 domain-containing protein [Vibrio vulnificus]
MVNKILLLILLIYPTLSYSIDNPDTPNYISNFTELSEKYENEISNSKFNNVDILYAYNEYMLFLDDELNKSFLILKKKMTSENFLKLQQSQRQWILYRDMEFKLIESNWTRNNFGSSYRLSQLSYKSSVIKNRVIQLYYYANNY